MIFWCFVALLSWFKINYSKDARACLTVFASVCSPAHYSFSHVFDAAFSKNVLLQLWDRMCMLISPKNSTINQCYHKMCMKKEIELSRKNNHKKPHSKTAADLNKKT